MERGDILEAGPILVLDEADRMLDMGFKPAVDRIVRQMPRERQTLFLGDLEGAAGKVAAAYTSIPAPPRPQAEGGEARRGRAPLHPSQPRGEARRPGRRARHSERGGPWSSSAPSAARTAW